MEPVEKFNAHLDLCDQCRTRPFDLCGAGARLLKEAAHPTGRLPTAPEFQDMPPRTEVGRSLREAFKKEFGGPISIIESSTTALEHRVFGLLTEEQRGCFLCDAGVPFTKKS